MFLRFNFFASHEYYFSLMFRFFCERIGIVFVYDALMTTVAVVSFFVNNRQPVIMSFYSEARFFSHSTHFN